MSLPTFFSTILHQNILPKSIYPLFPLPLSHHSLPLTPPPFSKRHSIHQLTLHPLSLHHHSSDYQPIPTLIHTSNTHPTLLHNTNPCPTTLHTINPHPTTLHTTNTHPTTFHTLNLHPPRTRKHAKTV